MTVIFPRQVWVSEARRLLNSGGWMGHPAAPCHRHRSQVGPLGRVPGDRPGAGAHRGRRLDNCVSRGHAHAAGRDPSLRSQRRPARGRDRQAHRPGRTQRRPLLAAAGTAERSREPSGSSSGSRSLPAAAISPRGKPRDPGVDRAQLWLASRKRGGHLLRLQFMWWKATRASRRPRVGRHLRGASCAAQAFGPTLEHRIHGAESRLRPTVAPTNPRDVDQRRGECRSEPQVHSADGRAHQRAGCQSSAYRGR